MHQLNPVFQIPSLSSSCLTSTLIESSDADSGKMLLDSQFEAFNMEMFAFIFGHKMGEEPLPNGYSSNLIDIPFDEEFPNETAEDFNHQGQSQPTDLKSEALTTDIVAIESNPIQTVSTFHVKEAPSVPKAKESLKPLPKKKPVYKTAKANKTTKQKNNKSDPKRECGGCRRVFVSVHHLERHLHNRSRCRDRLCRICFKGFSSVDKLCTHVCTGKDGLFTCPQCKTQHLSAEFLLRHTCTTSKEDYSCIFCPREFKKDYSWTIHVLRHVSETPIFPCPTCDKPLPSSNSFVKQSKNNRFKCKICLDVFYEKAPLLAHLKLEHKDYLKKMYRCASCSKRYSFGQLVREKRAFYRASRADVAK